MPKMTVDYFVKVANVYLVLPGSALCCSRRLGVDISTVFHYEGVVGGVSVNLAIGGLKKD